MLEKIGKKEYAGISTPSWTFLTLLKSRLIFHDSLNIAEIGVGIGATAKEIVSLLRQNDRYYIFDYTHNVDELCHDLMQLPNSPKCNILKFGNSRKTFDSYAWTLAKFFIENISTSPIFDLVYLDGAHTFIHDAPSCCILKELIKPGGYLVLDDMEWSFSISPTANPKNHPIILEQYTDEQIATSHVALVAKVFLDTDKRFKRIRLLNDTTYRGIYKKLNINYSSIFLNTD